MVIEDAKVYALNHGRSLSEIMEEYLKSIVSNEKLFEIVYQLKSSVKTPKDFKSYKETLKDALVEKYQ